MISTAIIAAASLATFARGINSVKERMEFKRQALQITHSNRPHQGWWYMDVNPSSTPMKLNAASSLVDLPIGSDIVDEGLIELVRRTRVGGRTSGGFYTAYVPILGRLAPRFCYASLHSDGVRIVGRVE